MTTIDLLVEVRLPSGVSEVGMFLDGIVRIVTDRDGSAFKGTLKLTGLLLRVKAVLLEVVMLGTLSRRGITGMRHRRLGPRKATHLDMLHRLLDRFASMRLTRLDIDQLAGLGTRISEAIGTSHTTSHHGHLGSLLGHGVRKLRRNRETKGNGCSTFGIVRK